ncbi:MAG: DUF5320 domain-containing protein [Chloroflexi bacterium]|nr:DUF5320 domain-containing protein [Chloroflexota bacterium]
MSYGMHRKWRGLGFNLGFSPFGFWFRRGYFPRRSEYVKMLEEYKAELEAEIKEVNQELAELKAEPKQPRDVGEEDENLGH